MRKMVDVNNRWVKTPFHLGLHACGTQSDFAKEKVVWENEYVLISFICIDYRIFLDVETEDEEGKNDSAR